MWAKPVQHVAALNCCESLNLPTHPFKCNLFTYIGFEGSPVPIVATTNRLAEIDPGFKRRLGQSIHVDLPSEVTEFHFYVLVMYIVPRLYFGSFFMIDRFYDRNLSDAVIS